MFIGCRFTPVDPGQVDIFDPPGHHMGTVSVHKNRAPKAVLNAPSAKPAENQATP
ncbi:hypothetical protein BSU04_26095 [Caballeronia sordidicola]|uniref:Uncharacterized protein n=1 Tax=Caballeronia sordidicola TaxID=196367 RepID=A0A226WWX7_CABSO|nr:hypothetical protein BSU04_26095 [Caballeronia sordidicola]